MKLRGFQHPLPSPEGDPGTGGGGDANAWKATFAGGNQDYAKALEPFKDQAEVFSRLTATPEAPDWRKVLAGENPEDLKVYERYTDPGAVTKAFKSAQAALSDGGRVKIPGKDAAPEEIAAFNKALGVPEKIDGYKIEAKPPEGYTPSETDNKFLSGMTEKLHKAGATPAMVNTAHQLYWDALTDSTVQSEERAADAALESERTLKAKWGSDFNSNMEYAVSAWKQFFPGSTEEFDNFFGQTLQDGTKLGDHPLMLQIGATMGRQLGEDPFANKMREKNPGFDLNARKSEILAMRASNPKEYARLTADGGELDKINQALLTAEERKNAA